MATAGGPDSIGELRVDIVGDDSQLDAAIDRAKSKVDAAAAGGGASTGSTPDQEWAKVKAMAGGMGGPPTAPPIADAGGGMAATVGGVVSAAAIAGAIAIAVEKFEQAAKETAKSNYEMGKTLGDILSSTAKQMMELEQAIRFNAEALKNAQGTRRAAATTATAGNPNAGSYAMDVVESLETENEGLQGDLSKRQSNIWRRTLDKFSEKFSLRETAGFALKEYADITGGYDQINANKDRIAANMNDATGPMRAGKRFSYNSAVAAADDALGVEYPAGMANGGGQGMGQQQWHLLVEAIKASGKENAEMITRQMTLQGQQQTIRNVTGNIQGNP